MRRERISETYCADFETTSLANLNVDGYVRVYLWSLVNLERTEEYYGFTIESFFAKLIELQAKKVWFHNLRFDGAFIIDYLERNNYVYGDAYTTIIDNMNIWYEIKLICEFGEIKIWDSLKKFPGQSVKSIAKMYNYPDKKEPPRFDRYLPENYTPYPEEIEYCLQDSRIIANALYQEYQVGHKGITLSSDAFRSVQESIGGFMKWRDKMPKLPAYLDAFVRESYKGGWVYVNPVFQNIPIKNVTVLDVNSLYPHVMRNTKLPLGLPKHKKPIGSQLAVMKFRAAFKLKDGYLPTVQIKNSPLYNETEYLTESMGEVELTMTSIDYELFKEHYDIIDMTTPDYWSFQGKVGLLKDYIDYWTNVKIQATKDHNESLRYIAKRYLNSPYGKTGMRTERVNKIPYLDDEGDIRFGETMTQTDGIYVPYASFVCAQARNITIRSAQKHYEQFVYADTDSLHLIGDDFSGLDIDPVKLGAWKIEGQFERAKYIRPKTYIHAKNDYTVEEIKCAGMPDDVKATVNWDNFRDGQEFGNKLMQKRVKGGVVLCPTTYKIKSLVS